MAWALADGACGCCLARAAPAERTPLRERLGLARDSSDSLRARFRIPPSGRLRLERATVVDPRDGSLSHGASIVVDAGRIVGLEQAGGRPDPSVQRIDAAGKFVVPGYNDMHVHVLELADPAGALALMLAEGVTGFRQMSGSRKLLERRRKETLPVGRLAPAALELPGNLLTPFTASSAEQVRAEIAAQKKQGADFVKAGFMSGAVFRAALHAARDSGIPLLGHLQDGVDAADASQLGFRTVEHLGPGAVVWIACSSAEEELKTEVAALPLFKPPPFKIPFLRQLVMWRLQAMLINPAAFAAPAHVERLQRALDTYSEEKCRALAATFVTNGTWHVPTLVRLRTQELAGAPEYENSADLRYLPKKKLAQWRKVTQKFLGLPAATRATYAGAYPRQLLLTKAFADAGVRMMTGTDGGWLSGPGLTLQEEFAELGKAGLTPLAILRMATSDPAEYLGRTATMGAVEPGKNADLVLLDANPLESVANLGRIAGVVRAGFHHSRQELDALRERVARGRGFLA